MKYLRYSIVRQMIFQVPNKPALGFLKNMVDI